MDILSHKNASEQRQHEKRYTLLPEHLSLLMNDQWALWRNVVVRGAGFPVSHVLRLAHLASSQAADEVLAAEKQWQSVRDSILERLRDQVRQTIDKAAAHTLKQAIKAIKNGHLTSELAIPEKEELLLTYTNWQRKIESFMQIYAEANTAISTVLYDIASDQRFQEAIIWQNRAALHASIASFLRHGIEGHGSEQRRREALIANYIQRYCTKNESIGFFGPLGWAKLVATGASIAVKPGDTLLEKRGVYFEGWAIDVLAEEMAKDNALLPFCAPRLLPHISYDGTWLSLPFASPVKLSKKQRDILNLCDGVRTASEIVSCLQRTSTDSSENEIYALLAQLKATKRIEWTLEVPVEGEPRSHPEVRLHQLLERIEDQSLRAEKLNTLEQLVQARDAVARAAGETSRLDDAFEHLEQCFSKLTQRDATRSAGHIYAGRTLVYEDCRRDISVSLGPDFVRTLENPLALLLQSARWFTYEVAQSYRAAFMQAFEELIGDTGDTQINFAHFWLWAQPLLFDESAERPIDEIIAEFQARWMDILCLPSAEKLLRYSSDELLPYVQDAFAAPGPGWRDACYHSPDILLQAESIDAIRRGQYQLVLGELHMAMNTQQHLAFLEQYPDPDELIQFATHDIPEPRIVPLFSKNNYPMTRMRPALIAPKDFRLLYAADVTASPSARVLPISALYVERKGESLVVSTKDGHWQFEIIDVFAEFLSRLVYKEFNMAAPAHHTPRVVVDQMVFLRETWNFKVSELTFEEKDPARRFLSVRAWAQSTGLPRFIFVKVPNEFKPCFIDLASPLYVDTFVRLVRSNKTTGDDEKRIRVTEMLPAPDQSWLLDADGEHYTSELRFVAVDMVKSASDCELF